MVKNLGIAISNIYLLICLKIWQYIFARLFATLRGRKYMKHLRVFMKHSVMRKSSQICPKDVQFLHNYNCVNVNQDTCNDML